MNFIEKCRNYKYANIILALVFALTLFLQCCFFHWQAFNTILISSLWKNPTEFFIFYIPKICISLFFTSFIFLFKRKSWTIFLSIIVSIWSISELVYSRIYNSFLDPYTILLANNMNGFWDSIFPLIYISDCIFVLLNIIYIIFYILYKNKNTSTYIYIIIFIISLFLQVISAELLNIRTVKLTPIETKKQLSVNKSISYQYYNPFSNYFLDKIYGGGNTNIQYHDEYPKDLSVIHHFILNISSLFNIKKNHSIDDNITIPTHINKFINKNNTNINYNYNKLIIILVESLENWTITDNITPNLKSFIDNNDNILYATKITKQTLKSASADGQMIINTGILPTKNGHVCYDYFQNTYPALSKLYNKSSALIPGHLGMWNQRAMSSAYGINSSYSINPNDSYIIEQTIRNYSNNDYLLSLTISSHLPFTEFKDSSLIKSNYKPQEVSDYINCINFFDIKVGRFLELIETDSILRNSTIVITSDHTILTTKMRYEFSEYCKENSLDYKVEENYCPLIIYSPNIKKKTVIDEVTYQMDIYPTILHIIGAEDYYWKGFGVNLLDSIAIKNRPITPEEAFDLSDKLIRANYFKQIEDSLYRNP